jgi:hypothetical protein
MRELGRASTGTSVLGGVESYWKTGAAAVDRMSNWAVRGSPIVVEGREGSSVAASAVAEPRRGER